VSLVFRDGKLIEEDVAPAPGPGTGGVSGNGVYETLRVDAGVARDVEAHLERLEAGVERLGLDIPESRDDLERAVAAVAAAAPRPVARLRILVRREDAGCPPTRLIAAVAYDPPSPEDYHSGVPAVIDRRLVVDPAAPLAGVKVLAREALAAALARAESRGAFEALLLNRHGRVAEGSRSNVIVALDEATVTPPVAEGCLPGTVRRRLLEAGAVCERPVEPAELERARGVLLTSSMMGVLPVRRIDDRDIPVGDDGERLRRHIEGDDY
jgi:branched-chain amino acid aminotransferase